MMKRIVEKTSSNILDRMKTEMKSSIPPPIPAPYPPRWFEGVCSVCGDEEREWTRWPRVGKKYKVVVTLVKDTRTSATRWVCNQCHRETYFEIIDPDLVQKGIK